MDDVAGYMGIIYAGLLVTAAYNTLAAFLRALGDSKSPLYFLIISAGINVVLDVVLIRFAGMGVDGCAYATVIAQAVSAICCLIYIIKRYPILHLKKENFRLQQGVWKTSFTWNTNGTAVFYYCNWYDYCAECGKYLWSNIYGRFFGCR